MTKYYKQGYPRPQFVRNSYFSLNGEWNFRFDYGDTGITNGWQNGFYDTKIIVPFSYESNASGIGCKDPCKVIWYSKEQVFTHREDTSILLNFEGSDYSTKLWVNGIYIGYHEGGYSRFTFDITYALREGSNRIVCRIEDSFSTTQPRGKQRWLNHNYDCWYTQTSGIWKDVWAEEVCTTHFNHLLLTPIYDENSVELEYDIAGISRENLELETIISFQDQMIYSGKDCVLKQNFSKRISLIQDQIKWKVRYWCPKSPNLYDVQIRLYQNGILIDEVGSYFGLRKIATDSNRIKLNNMDIYLKMILDQGYWEDSLLTPPNEDALILDIKKILAYGYNGVRKHQKIEDERFYYWTDVLGLLVWCEAPSFYEFNRYSIETVTKEWMQIVNQHYNHPSIITWVPFNESWGVPRISYDKKQQHFTQSLYYLTKSFDQTRPVISNDGWEHTKSDIITLHDYAEDGAALLKNWANSKDNLDNKRSFNGVRYAFAETFHYEGQPIIISEFGGIAFEKQKEGWGYGIAETTEADYLNRLKSLIDSLEQLDDICGYCYTQLTDVEQEQNGHMDMRRRDKINEEKLREILQGNLCEK